MPTPTLGAYSSAVQIPTIGGSPRTLTLAIGEPTGGEHRALILYTCTGDDSDAVTGVTVTSGAGGTMTALAGINTLTVAPLYPYIIKNPTTDGSGNCVVSLAMTGDANYSGRYWWAIVDDVDNTTPWVDVGAETGNSTGPVASSVTLAAGDLALCGMVHNFSSTSSVSGTGNTQVMQEIYTSKPHAIASRATTGVFQWTTGSSNLWSLSVVKFQTTDAVPIIPMARHHYTQLSS